MENVISFYTRHAFQPATTEERRKILSHLENKSIFKEDLTEEENAIANSIKVRKLYRLEDINHIGRFITDNIQGRHLSLQRGNLGLTQV